MKTALLLMLSALVLTGCATSRPRPVPLTQADVISMVKAGASEEDIIRRIDETGTVFRLNAEDVVRLRQEGVSDRVVTYMLDTFTRAAVEQERRYNSNYHYSIGLWYGHPWHYHHRWHHW